MNTNMVVATCYKLAQEDGRYNVTSHNLRIEQYTRLVPQGYVDKINAQSADCGLMFIVDQEATEKHEAAGRELAKERAIANEASIELKDLAEGLVKASKSEKAKKKSKKKKENKSESED